MDFYLNSTLSHIAKPNKDQSEDTDVFMKTFSHGLCLSVSEGMLCLSESVWCPSVKTYEDISLSKVSLTEDMFSEDMRLSEDMSQQLLDMSATKL